MNRPGIEPNLANTMLRRAQLNPERIAGMATKARTIQNSGRAIEQCAADLKQDLDDRLAFILELLRRSSAG